MRKSTAITTALMLLLLTMPLIAQDDDEGEGGDIPSGVDGYVSFNAIEGEEWQVIDFEGEGISTATGQASFRLEVGGDYYFDLSNVDSERYPLDIISSNGKLLLSQREDAVTSDLDGVDSSADEDGVRFVLTEDLAEQISRFRAATYPQMYGFISAVPEGSHAEAEEARQQAAEEQEAEAEEGTDEAGGEQEQEG
ncbi:MAG: hypothetical protein ACQETQ_09835 [Spirochaetota bacterium]